MKKYRFEPPTDYYDERVSVIDEQICALIQERKEVSGNNPGFPPLDRITDWAEKYGIAPELLGNLFAWLLHEEQFRLPPEPFGYRKNISLLKTVEMDDRYYTLSFIRQFENASVVQFTIDWDEPERQIGDPFDTHNFEMFLKEPYRCRLTRGGGSNGHYHYKYIVTPPLPDNLQGTELVFKEYRNHPKKEPTGLEVVFRID
ncbi:hypothetical protein [Bacillus sp. FJAT-27245]|uniref:hypothetical protein n=1 Tax=Bacillus sp. FJAT-27245 TaxID=1684144 RepID=UPI0006A77E77|nr:hypothetical protein [Bacillus sp. FJAT-27245]